MQILWDKLNKNLRLIKALVRIAFLESFSFRLDMLFGLLSSIIWMGIPIIFFKVIFLNVDKIVGWTFNECLLLVGIYTFIDGFMMGFLIRSMPKLEYDIREGSLDSILVKPLNSQLYYFFRSIDFTQFLNSLLGVGVIIYALTLVKFNWLQLVLALISCILGGIIYYSLWFIWVISAFWFPTNFGRTDLFLSMITIGRYPSVIYKGVGYFIFNFLLPFGLIATPATVVLIRSNDEIMLLQLIVTIVFVALDVILWKLGVRKYDGAGR